LLNRSHPFHDLILVLDAEDKRLVDAINGRSSVTEIAANARVTERGRVRTLFERLWWYDQVAFDASNARPAKA
jgi:hypothetical protein